MSWLGRRECGCEGECEDEASGQVTMRPEKDKRCRMRRFVESINGPRYMVTMMNEHPPELRTDSGL